MSMNLVNAYGRCGMGFEAIHLYQTIPESMRDPICHVCVLNACSHVGLIDQAQQIYQQIDSKTEEIITTMVNHSFNPFMTNHSPIIL